MGISCKDWRLTELKENVLISPTENTFEIEVGINESISNDIQLMIKRMYCA